jgi:recombinational DNA repair protein (RecF pathway)
VPTYPVHALTLRRWRRRETDRTYRVLTLEHGVLEVSVQGAAKIGSKLAGHVEPFSETRLLLARSRGPFRVAGAQVQRRFSSSNSHTMQRLAQVAAIAEQLVSGDHSQPEAYAAVANAWNELLATPLHQQQAVVAAAALELCSLMGYQVPASETLSSDSPRFLQFMDRYLTSVLPYPVHLG